MLVSHFSNGAISTFPLPGSISVNGVTVNGVAATVSSSDAFSVTLAAIPVKGAAVVIDFNPSSAVVRDAYTWATKPSAALVPVGTIIRISDVGPAPGIRVWSDGTRWVPMGAQLLARRGTAIALTGVTAETVMDTVTIPAGAMGLSGGLHIYSTWSNTNSANSKLARIRLGGIAGAQFLASSVTTTVTLNDLRRIRNRGSATSQVGSTAATAASPLGSSGVAVSTAAVDTGVAVDLVFTGQLTLATETLTLENSSVWLTP